MTDSFPSHPYSEDVTVLHHQEKTIILVGTAHISQMSVDLVEKVIRQERPDGVCLELDEKRFLSLTQKKQWQALDLKKIIKNKQLSTLIINLMMAAYQKKLGKKLGIKPGTELLSAALCAKELNIPIALCDRVVRVTRRRTWKTTSILKKAYLLTTLFTSLFDKTELSEEKLAELKQKDVLSELMGEIGHVLPDVKKVIIDERDIFLSEKIKATPVFRLVAIVGAGHLQAIRH